MPDQPQTADDVKALVAERDIRFIRFWFTDILGQLKSFSVDPEQLDGAFQQGLGFDGSSITGFNAIEESDMVAMPDPTTFRVLPWRPEEQGVARMFCDVLTPERTPYEGDPRHVLRRALQRAEGLGFDLFDVGAEPEYFLFRDNKNAEPLDEGGYFDLTTLDAGSDVRRDTVLALEQLGIGVDLSHHEGGPSQHEIDLRHGEALKIADDVMTCRITVKELALNYGWHATFMPKPIYGVNGSGMHTHMTLFKDGTNAFFDADDPYFLSDVGEGLHRRSAAPRARAVLDLRPVGELLQAPRPRLRGTRLRRLEPSQPLGARARAALPPRRRGGDAHGAALPRPRVQPVPDLRVAAAGRAGGHREGLRATRADGAQPLPPRPG